MTLTLENLIVGEIFAVLMVFCRIGAAMTMLPGVGESYVSARARLLLALTVSYVLAPFIRPLLPAPPASPLVLGLLIAGESLIGLYMGLICRIMLSAMHTAGMIIATASGLSAAMLFDTSQGTQSTAVSVFLTLVATGLILALDLHHTMLRAYVDSYSLMSPGVFPPAADMSNYIAHMVGESFDIGIRMASPVLAAIMVLNVGSGLIARLMPQLPVFFLITPVQVMLAFNIMMVTLFGSLLWYSHYLEDAFARFLVPTP